MSNSKTLPVAKPGVMNDRTLSRLIGGLLVLLAIGLPAIAITYYLDRHVDSGPSIAGRAVIAAEQAVRDNPNQLSLRLVLAQAYRADNRPTDAISQYAIVLGTQPRNGAALLGRGDLYRETGQLDAAVADYLALIDVAKDGEMANVDRSLQSAYYGMGAILYAQGKPREAATQLANALVIDKTDADALDLMGQSLTAIGDYANAVAALRDAVNYVPVGWSDPYVHLAQAYAGLMDPAGVAYANAMVALSEGRVAEAESALQALVGGNHARDALIGLGLAAEQRGDPEAASGFYLQVLAVTPNDFMAQTGLSRVGVPASATPAESTIP